MDIHTMAVELGKLAGKKILKERGIKHFKLMNKRSLEVRRQKKLQKTAQK